MSPIEIAWVGIGFAQFIPTFVISARYFHEDMPEEVFINVVLSVMIAGFAILLWPLILALGILASITWAMYQLAIPGKFELPMFIQHHRYKRSRR